MRFLIRPYVLAVAVIFLAAQVLSAQNNSASVIGTVTDPSGSVVPGAHLTILQPQTGYTRSVTTNANGSFLIPLLPIGSDYQLTAQAPGFNTFVQSGISLQINQTAQVNVHLQVGSVSTKVEVRAEVPLINTYSAAGGDVVGTRRIQELPLNGRNVLQLASLLPGVTVSETLTALTSGDRHANFVNVNGSRHHQTDYKLDGMRYQGSYINSGLDYPNPDALQEFKLQTSAYNAESGYYAGSIFNAVTRSGTNELHGSAWEFLRNDALNARNYFAKTVPRLRQNQFGASLGFPIVKNHVFGFVSYQGLKIGGDSLASSFPLTADERRGVFDRTIKDPDNGGAPFPDNTIPGDRINPVAATLLDKYIPEAPTTNGGQLVTVGAEKTRVDQWLGKVSSPLTTKDYTSATYFFDRTEFDAPFGTGPYPAYGKESQDQVVWLLALNETHTFSPHVINQFSGGLSGQEETHSCGADVTPQSLGINLVLQGPPEPPIMSVSGRFGMGNGTCLWVEGGTNWQIDDSVTWVKGRHNFKFGVSLYHSNFHLITGNNDPGNFSFTGSITGDAAADFLLGRPTTVLRRSVIDFAMKHLNSGYFVQDDFRVLPRLTLNLGLRYELMPPYAEYRGPELPNVGIPENATFRLGMQSTVIPEAPPGLLFYGDKTPDFPDGLPSTMVRLDKTQIEPRFGLAWDVFGNAKTAFRASYGIYSNSQFGDMGAQSFQNPPFRAAQTLLEPAGGLSDPWQGVYNPFPYKVDLTNPGPEAFPLPLTAFGWQQDFKNPRVQFITANVQQELSRNFMFSAGYVGKLARHAQDGIGINQARYIPGVDEDGNPLSTIKNTDSRRILVPNTYSHITMRSSVANATFHSLQASARYRSGNLSLLAAYTFSKSIDTNSGTPTHQNYLDLAADRGLSDFDRRHVFRLSGVYDIPRFNVPRAASALINGWELSGMTALTSGAPFTITSGRDNSLSGINHDRPNLVGNPDLPGGRSHAEQVTEFFNKAAFAPNATGTFGNVGRNSMIGPGSADTDIGVMRNIPLVERLTTQFRAEIFNVFNHTNFGNPVSVVTSSGFGRLTSAGAPRIVQFALKLKW